MKSEPDTEPDPSESSLEGDKLRREIEKLDEEIASFRVRWWKKPAYLAAFLPTLIGLLSISVGLWTGAIQTKLEVIDLKSERLQDKQEQYDQAKADLEADQKALETERRQYEDAKKKLEAKIEKLERERAHTGLLLHLNALVAEGENLWPLHDSFPALVSELKSSGTGEAAELVQARLSPDNAPVLQAHLYLALYHGTGDQAWKGELFDLARTEPKSSIGRFWSTFGTTKVDWSAEDNHEIVNILSEILSGHKADRTIDTPNILDAILYHLPRGQDHTTRFFEDNPHAFDTVQVARDVMLDAELQWTGRIKGLGLLVRVAPRAFLVTASKVVTEHERDIDLFAYIERALAGGGIYGSVPAEIRNLLEVPETLNRDSWNEWRRRNEPLVALVTESDLGKWRDSPQAIKSLLPVKETN